MMNKGKCYATAMITDPSAVTAKCSALGQVAHKGAIFCSIPELGFEGVNLVYCRYGMSIPYIQVQQGWKLWVEPTILPDSRWVYTGFADCDNINPASADQFYIQLLSQVIYASTAGKIYLSSKTASEPFVKGNELKTWCEAVDASLAKLLDWAKPGGTGGAVAPGPTGGITPLTTVSADYTEFPTAALSTKINGE